MVHSNQIIFQVRKRHFTLHNSGRLRFVRSCEDELRLSHHGGNSRTVFCYRETVGGFWPDQKVAPTWCRHICRRLQHTKVSIKILTSFLLSKNRSHLNTVAKIPCSPLYQVGWQISFHSCLASTPPVFDKTL